jgi:hypothetical protein
MFKSPALNNKKLLTYSFLFFTILFLAAVLPLVANAQDSNSSVIVENRPVTARSEFKPHVGVLTGVANTEGNYQSGFEYGATIGYQPYIPFGIGMELSTAYNNVSSGPEQFDFQRTKLLVQGTYNFGGNIPIIAQSYVGVAIGPMLESINNDTELVVGTMPTLGFDYPFALRSGEDVSLGLNARYLVSSSGVPNTFGVNAMAKYWF